MGAACAGVKGFAQEEIRALVLYLQIVVTAVLAAAVGVALLVALRAPARTAAAGATDAADTVVFLFDGERLVDASPAARALLQHSPARDGSPWQRLLAWLGPRFPGAVERLGLLETTGRIMLPNAENEEVPLTLSAEIRGGLTRIAIVGHGDAVPEMAHPVSAHATAEELASLRDIVGVAPLPIWQTDAQGEITWANGAYLSLVAARLKPGQDFVWPLPHVFDELAARMGAERQRQTVETGGDPPARWFDLETFPVRGDAANGRLHFALPADHAVQAETALKGFMQTLARTFAHLSTGLAIFDHARRLALYNPALVDLTGLPPDFLSGRPTLVAVLDAMRERLMLPEPKDWRVWRKRIADLEAAAAQGHYEETWSLSSGQTYRVSGRPHPNGALALMLDDISSEIGQTRRYRADLELGQAVIDAMEEAIAVFSAAGTLVLSNAAYTALWGHDPGGALDNDATFAAMVAQWRAQSAPSPVWDRAEAFAAQLGPRTGWSDEVRLNDGRLIVLRIERIAGGATLAGFHVASGMAPSRTAVFASVRRSA